MELIYFFLIIILISFFNSFSMRFQSATLYWGKKLQPDNELLPRGMQNAITPSFQNFRNIFLPISIIAIMIIGLIFFKWYIALLSGPIAFIIGGLFTTLLPKPESKYYYDKIRNVLLKKKNIFTNSNDSIKLIAIEDIIMLFDQITPKS